MTGVSRKNYTETGRELFNHIRARYCRFMLYMYRENLILKILITLLFLALGIGISYFKA